MVMCTARYCPYERSCYRHIKGDPNDVSQSYVDLSYE